MIYRQPSRRFPRDNGKRLAGMDFWGSPPEEFPFCLRNGCSKKIKEMNKFFPTSPLDVHLSDRYNCIINQI